MSGSVELVTRRAFLVAACAAPLLARQHPRLADTPGEKVTFFQETRELFAYQYAHGLPKPYVHPILAANGAAVSLAAPADHLHHRGLMLGWTDIGGRDFWGEPKSTPGPHGSIEHQLFERLDEKSASLTAVNHWMADERALLVERRTLTAAKSEEKFVTFDWISEFTAPAGEVTLMAAKGGYDGLGLRFPHEMDGGKVLNSQGSASISSANGEAADWCAYWGPEAPVGANGVAILNHPSNPRRPSPFFVMSLPFGYLSAAPTFREPLRVRKGAKLRLAYRIIVFGGFPSIQLYQELGQRYTQFAATR